MYYNLNYCIFSLDIVVCFQMKQLRTNKRQETMLAKRSLGIDGSPPHVIVGKCV